MKNWTFCCLHVFLYAQWCYWDKYIKKKNNNDLVRCKLFVGKGNIRVTYLLSALSLFTCTCVKFYKENSILSPLEMLGIHSFASMYSRVVRVCTMCTYLQHYKLYTLSMLRNHQDERQNSFLTDSALSARCCCCGIISTAYAISLEIIMSRWNSL